MVSNSKIGHVALFALLGLCGVAQGANVVDVDVIVKSSSINRLTIPRAVSGGFLPIGAPGSPSSYTLLTRISIDARGGGDGAFSVQSWDLELQGTSSSLAPHNRAFNPQTSQSYAGGNKPKLVSQDVALVVPTSALADWGKLLCENKVAEMVQIHHDRNFARMQEYEVYVRFHPKLSYKTSPGDRRGGMDAVSQEARMTFVCQGAPTPATPASVPAGPHRNVPARIDSVQLELNYPASPANCPVDAAVKTTFRATQPGPFKARIVSVSGRASAWRDFSMDDADRQPTGLWSKTWNETLRIPASARGAAAGSGLMGSGAGGPASRGPTGGYAAPSPAPNVHQDALWVEISGAAGGSIPKSDSRDYRVTCPMTTMPAAGALTGGVDPQRPGSTPGLTQPSSGRPAVQIPSTPIQPPPVGGRPPATGVPSSPPATPTATPASARPTPSMPVGTRSR